MWRWTKDHPFLAAAIATLIVVSAAFPVIAPATAALPYVGPIVAGWIAANPAWMVPIAAASSVALSVVSTGLIAGFVWLGKKLFGRTPPGGAGSASSPLDGLETDPDYLDDNQNGKGPSQPQTPRKKHTHSLLDTPARDFEIVSKGVSVEGQPAAKMEAVQADPLISSFVVVDKRDAEESDGAVLPVQVSIGRSSHSLHGSRKASDASFKSQSPHNEAAEADHADHQEVASFGSSTSV